MLGIFTFPLSLAPSLQHVGCRFLGYPSLAEQHYGSKDLDRNSKEKNFQKQRKIWPFLLIFR